MTEKSPWVKCDTKEHCHCWTIFTILLKVLFSRPSHFLSWSHHHCSNKRAPNTMNQNYGIYLSLPRNNSPITSPLPFRWTRAAWAVYLTKNSFFHCLPSPTRRHCCLPSFSFSSIHSVIERDMVIYDAEWKKSGHITISEWNQLNFDNWTITTGCSAPPPAPFISTAIWLRVTIVNPICCSSIPGLCFLSGGINVARRLTDWGETWFTSIKFNSWTNSIFS